MTIQCRVVLAAGGTGGHIFPAEAVAEELKARGYKVCLITDKRAREYKGTLADIERFTINAGTFGRGFKGKVTAVGEIVKGIFEAKKLLKTLQADVVIGFGGYPSFPTLYAAAGLGIPTLIHEQNSVLGRANRMLLTLGKVDTIATTFATTRLLDKKYQAKSFLTGNPVRSAIKVLSAIHYPTLSDDGNMRILVTGGSQGASIFSQIIPEAIADLPLHLRKRIRIDQQCRRDEVESTRLTYNTLGVSHDIADFFNDIPARLAGAHLVIARSGASTIAELAAAGRPSILVPLPSSMDNHQYYNANELDELGGAWLMPQEGFTAHALASKIEGFLNLPETLARAAEYARNYGKINAASDLAALVVNIAAKRKLKAQ